MFTKESFQKYLAPTLLYKLDYSGIIYERDEQNHFKEINFENASLLPGR